jgi:hypothetical protein
MNNPEFNEELATVMLNEGDFTGFTEEIGRPSKPSAQSQRSEPVTCPDCGHKYESASGYTECPECKSDRYVYGAPSSEPPSSAEATEGKQEWVSIFEPTSSGFYICSAKNRQPLIDQPFDRRVADIIVEAHNAALAAERGHIEYTLKVHEQHNELDCRFRDEKIIEADDLRQKLLAAQAAIKSIREQAAITAGMNWLRKYLDDSDNFQNELNEHDAEVRKPLVDALEKDAATFADLRRLLRMMSKHDAARACGIAEKAICAVLSQVKDT